MRLLVAEEALKDTRGHWYEFNRAVVQEARRRGIATTVLAHKDLQPELRLELGAVPFFPATSWDGIYYHPSALRRYLGILRHNLLIAGMLARYLEESGPYDVILIPTVVLHHWLAWRWLAWRGRGRWYRKLVLMTRNNAGEYDPVARRYLFKSSAQVLRRIIRSFRGAVAKGEVELATDSSKIAEQYDTLCAIRFATYPHPVDDTADPPRRRSLSGASSLTFSTLGSPRYEKGSDLVLEAVRIVLADAACTNLRFAIQWTGECHDPSGHRILPGTDIEENPSVTLITSDLSSGEYRDLLAQTDVMLLPYRAAQYHARLSGVAVEAFRMGIPCICFANTWVSDSMNRLGAGIALGEESAPALAEAIVRLADNHREYAEKARTRAGAAREHHSTKAFVDALLRVPNR